MWQPLTSPDTSVYEASQSHAISDSVAGDRERKSICWSIDGIDSKQIKAYPWASKDRHRAEGRTEFPFVPENIKRRRTHWSRRHRWLIGRTRFIYVFYAALLGPMSNLVDEVGNVRWEKFSMEFGSMNNRSSSFVTVSALFSIELNAHSLLSICLLVIRVYLQAT